MADNRVGTEITRWLLEHYRDDLSLVVTTAENELFAVARAAAVDALVFESSVQVAEHLARTGAPIDLGVLAWWPTLIRQPLLGLPAQGFINTHPSLLPHNRGKHYNFWALVEQAPFGVSLHLVDDGVDSGDIVAQAPVAYDWEDTGGTLHAKACEEMLRLFRDTYPTLRTMHIPRKPQDLGRGSLHLARELDPASVIHLDESYRARDLLNLLRARTFPGHPACTFQDAGDEYEVRIHVTRKSR